MTHDQIVIACAGAAVGIILSAFITSLVLWWDGRDVKKYRGNYPEIGYVIELRGKAGRVVWIEDDRKNSYIEVKIWLKK